jgi:hypothetical protein
VVSTAAFVDWGISRTPRLGRVIEDVVVTCACEDEGVIAEVEIVVASCV